MNNIVPLEIQGDVALRKCKSIPQGAVKIDDQPLALGETSGHAHVIVSDKQSPTHELFVHNGVTYVAVGSDGAQLQHVRLKTGEKADHDAIDLAENTIYQVILQNEYNPEAEAFQRVED